MCPMHLNIYKVQPVSSEATTRLAYNVVWICAPQPAHSKGIDHDMEQGILFQITVHQILAALCPFENFGNFLVSN